MLSHDEGTDIYGMLMDGVLHYLALLINTVTAFFVGLHPWVYVFAAVIVAARFCIYIGPFVATNTDKSHRIIR